MKINAFLMRGKSLVCHVCGRQFRQGGAEGGRVLDSHSMAVKLGGDGVILELGLDIGEDREGIKVVWIGGEDFAGTVAGCIPVAG